VTPAQVRPNRKQRLDGLDLDRLLPKLALLAAAEGSPAVSIRRMVEAIAKATRLEYVAVDMPSASLHHHISASGEISAVAIAERNHLPTQRVRAARHRVALKPAGGLKSGLILPLLSPGSMVGTLTLGSALPARKDDGFEKSAQKIATVAAVFSARLCSMHNVTESWRKFEILFEGVPEAVLLIDPERGTITDVNSETLRVTGWTRKDLVKRSMASLFSPEHKKTYLTMLAGLKNDHALTKIGPVDLLKKNGKAFPAIIRAGIAAMQDGDTVFAILSDLTEQTRTEVKLAASEELLRIIVEGTLDMFFYVRNAKGEFTYLSPSVTKITGYAPDKLKSMRQGTLLTRNPINEQVKFYIRRALSQGMVAPAYLAEIRHAQGHQILLEMNEKPIFRDMKVIGLQGVARDITEKKRLEEIILESRDNLNRIVDQTPLAVMVNDADGTVSEVNEAWLRMFGMNEKGTIVNRLNVFRSPFFRVDNLIDRVREVIAGKVVDIPALTADIGLISPGSVGTGNERTFHIRIFPVIGRSGHLTNVVAMFDDVTERRQLEAQLIQSQKMESIGFLAGGIAHDFNNILGGILGYASFIKKRTGKEHDMYPHLETIEKSAMRAAELVSQLLAFARGGKYVVTPLAINDIMTETAGLLKGTLDKSISIDISLDPTSPVIEADAIQMQQVLMNLCVNARDAMPDGGRLVLRTVLIGHPDDFIRSMDGRAHGAFVRIDIQDSGVGIEAAIKDKIFDPFFTTKEKGKGTGLGLATVYGIVKNHGGHTRVESELKKGTTFSVYLPAVDAPAMPVKSVELKATGGNEQILVVDDEPTIRILLEDVLKEMGYDVVTAAGGAEALDLYAKSGAPFDLVILDMAMPEMNGKETFERLKDMDPGVRVILSTGYSQDERARELFALGIKGFVQKPYRVDDLGAAVRHVLDGGSMLGKPGE